MEVLAGPGVGGGEVGGVGDVDGNVEEGLGGWTDLGERGGSPESGVLVEGGGVKAAVAAVTTGVEV